ncbi:penicillin-binding protein, beta-lactamase class C [Beggiatoa alba B18LD]|uniref:Penicillin-binding protein, beta-lactamase class C n=1 Tax=Beggiatoa alba B18LD TaxID=395493 RepID=I3CF55_9GAMM|nr:serine hydrolase domain-containing protein [Beggiatoa alba]EIJ42248.1 penicillin-binding protein, beta-lactamase class C [Beggiatoa alba B18LD]
MSLSHANYRIHLLFLWCLLIITTNVHAYPTLDKNITRQLQQIVKEEIKQQNIPGAVVAISTPKGDWIEAVGFADKERRLAMQATDHFRVASVTKTFVAVVVLKFVEQGLLQLDEPIQRWLPPRVSRRLLHSEEITLRQLLNHTSGIPDYLESEKLVGIMQDDPYRQWSIEEILEYVYQLPPYTDRIGVVSYYSNTNYLLIELILKQITDESLASLIRRFISTPLNLQNTFFEGQEAVEFVQGYEDWDGDGHLDNVTTPPVDGGYGFADGGLVSSAEDLTTFIQALLAKKRLLSVDMLREMTSLVEDSEVDEEYGLGLESFFVDGYHVLGHSGRNTGFLTEMRYIPEADITIVVLINAGGEADPYQIFERLFSTLVKAKIG